MLKCKWLVACTRGRICLFVPWLVHVLRTIVGLCHTSMLRLRWWVKHLCLALNQSCSPKREGHDSFAQNRPFADWVRAHALIRHPLWCALYDWAWRCIFQQSRFRMASVLQDSSIYGQVLSRPSIGHKLPNACNSLSGVHSSRCAQEPNDRLHLANLHDSCSRL